MTDANKRMNPLHFGIDCADTQMPINPEIRIRILGHFCLRQTKFKEVHLALADVCCLWFKKKFLHDFYNHQIISRTRSSQSLPLHPGPHCGTPVAETTSSHGQTGKRRIEHFQLHAWNQLPTELKRTQSTSAFRRGLKTLLFNRAYCSE